MNTPTDDKDTDSKVKEIIENATAKKETPTDADAGAVDLGALSVSTAEDTPNNDTPKDDTSKDDTLTDSPSFDLETPKDETPVNISAPTDDKDKHPIDMEESFSQKMFRAEKSDDLFDTFDQELDSVDDDYADKYQKKSGTSFYTLMAGVALVGGLLGAVAVYIFDEKPNDPTFAQTKAPVIRPVEAVKVKPENPGGMTIKNKDVDVYNTVANKVEAKKDVQVVTPETPALPEKSVEKPATATAKPIANAPKVVEVKPTENTEQNPDASQSTPLQSTTAQTKPSPLKKIVAQKVAPKADDAPKPVIEANYALQLASVRSQKQAEKLWQQTLTKSGGVLVDKQLRIETINLKDKGDFFRVLAIPFADSASAKALCSQLKQKQIDCLPRKLKKN